MADQDTKEKIIATNALIEIEMGKWEELGAHPKNVETDTFILDAYTNALTLFLVEKGIIDEEEFVLFYKKHLYKNLVMARENFVEPAIKEMRRQQIVNGLPNMDIPKKPRQH